MVTSPPHTPPTRKSALTGLRPWTLVAVCCVLYLLLIYVHNGSTVNEFIFPQQTGKQGYDGQFTYFMAQDFSTAPQQILSKNDFPAYRIQRVLEALIVRVLSLGNADLIPWMMLLVGIVSLVVGTAALEQLLVDQGASRWYALGYGLFGGVFFAVRVTTSEPLAFGLVLLAILAYERQHLILNAVLLSLAVFAKEPAILSVGAYLLCFLLNRHWKDLIRLVVIGIVPFMIWQLVLYRWLGEFGVGSGGGGKSSFEIIPFGGILKIAQESMSAMLVMGPFLILGAVLPSIWALFTSGRDILQRKTLHPYAFLLFANAAIIPFVPFSTYREPLGIGRFLPGLVLSVILYAALIRKQRRARRPLLYSTLWVVWGLVLLG